MTVEGYVSANDIESPDFQQRSLAVHALGLCMLELAKKGIGLAVPTALQQDIETLSLLNKFTSTVTIANGATNAKSSIIAANGISRP